MLKYFMMSIKNILKKLNSRDTKIIPYFSKFSKIIIFSILIISGIFLSHKIFATDISQTATQFRAKQQAIIKGNNQEAWLNEALSSNLLSLIQAIGGSIPDAVFTGQQKWIPSGMVGSITKTITSLYTPPVSGIEYIAQTFNNFLGKPTYAQTTGFEGLLPILSIWKSFRNTAYAFFSLIFIIIGVTIMLRIKISPQAVITIQNSIPKIIATLVLITFSYAIAGLLIDISYFLMALVLTISNTDGSIDIAKNITDPDMFGLLWNLIPSGTISMIAELPGTIAALLGSNAASITAIDVAFSIGGGGLGGTILTTLILLILTLILFLKFLFGLAKCYISLIIRIIMGPIEIAIGAIPNSKMGFSSWIVNIIANLAVFPATIIFLNLVNIITASVKAGLWIPYPLYFTTGIVRDGDSLLSMIIGIGSFMLVSKIPSLIPEFIFQIKPSPFGKAIGENMNNNFVAGAVRTGWGGVKSGVGEELAQRAVPFIGSLKRSMSKEPTPPGGNDGGSAGGSAGGSVVKPAAGVANASNKRVH